MAPQLMIADEKYNINELKFLCEDVIYSKLNCENAIGILKLAESDNAKKLIEKVIDFVTNSLDAILNISNTITEPFIA